MPAQNVRPAPGLAATFPQSEASKRGPEWLQRLRRAAIERFQEHGVPTTRTEGWKSTDLSPVAALTPNEAAPRRVTPSELAPFIFDADADRLVFVDGRFEPTLSRVPTANVAFRSLADAWRKTPATLETNLGRHADFGRDALVALNTAYFLDGAFIDVPKGVVLERPLHLLFLQGSPGIVQARVLLHLGAGAQADIVEVYGSLAAERQWTNAVTESVLGDGARLRHATVITANDASYHTAHHEVKQGRDTTFENHAFLLGGHVVRNDIEQTFDAPGGDCTLNGLYLLDDSRHSATHTSIDHAQPHCTSREFYKGILDDQSRGVFYGKIYVRKDAQKSNAGQTNKNLILSDGATADSTPALEILADDVKAAHGSTIGQLDADALFYLRSRGLSEAASRSILTYGFARDILDRLPWKPVRSRLEERLRSRLPDGAAVTEA